VNNLSHYQPQVFVAEHLPDVSLLDSYDDIDSASVFFNWTQPPGTRFWLPLKRQSSSTSFQVFIRPALSISERVSTLVKLQRYSHSPPCFFCLLLFISTQLNPLPPVLPFLNVNDWISIASSQ
jgi:hypothetical protein